jgi:hypothetical protein
MNVLVVDFCSSDMEPEGDMEVEGAKVCGEKETGEGAAKPAEGGLRAFYFANFGSATEGGDRSADLGGAAVKEEHSVEEGAESSNKRRREMKVDVDPAFEKEVASQPVARQ